MLCHDVGRDTFARSARDLGGAADLLAATLREFRRLLAVEQHGLLRVASTDQHRCNGRVAFRRAQRQVDDAQRGHLGRARYGEPLLHERGAGPVDEADDELALADDLNVHGQKVSSKYACEDTRRIVARAPGGFTVMPKSRTRRSAITEPNTGGEVTCDGPYM